MSTKNLIGFLNGGDVRIIVCLGLVFQLVSYCVAVSLQYPGGGGVAEGDPAPGRSPGPPLDVTVNNGILSELPIVGTQGGENDPCDLTGDLIVVDKDKASIVVNFTHELFKTDVLTHGVVYQVTVRKRNDDNNLIQGFTVHSLGDGEARGQFSNSQTISRKCTSSSVNGALKDDTIIYYNWTLPVSDITRSNVTFRLRYKVHSSPSVFQVNYAFAVYKDCQIWLNKNEANISSIDFPKLPDCLVYFPGHASGYGLVLELTRLNVPCYEGGYLQFSANGNISQFRSHTHFRSHKQSHICGKLEEIPETERRIYFPNSKNHPSFIHLHGSPLFALTYHLVDYCYNITFTSRNASFELKPNMELQCTLEIFLPYGNRVVLRLEIGDPTVSSNLVTQNSLHTQSTEISTTRPCSGLMIELWDGSSSWMHCSKTGEAIRNFELESRENRVIIKVLVKGTEHNIRMKFRYHANPVTEIVQQCSFGWVAVRQFCVTAVDNVRLSWQQAELECVRRGGHLASIRSEQAQIIIDNLLLNSPGYRDQNAYWLGATDKTYEGDFRWSDGLPFTYTNWFPGWSQHEHYNRQPNDDGFSDQDCVELRRVYHLPSSTVRLAKSFMWNDRDCSTLNYFLCERLIADEPVEDGWPPECNRTIALSRQLPRASVSSPGFPRQYPDNAECETEISAPPGYRLVLDFEELVLEKEPYCSYDYLELIEMAPSTQNESSSRRLCGDWSSKLKLLRYMSVGSRIKLRFISDYSHHYGGFKARVSMENALQCTDDRLLMFNNSCYLFVSYPEVTWSTAQQICYGMRAQLASILTAEEQRFVTSNIRRTAEYRTSAVYWLGSKMNEYGNYKWTDGSSMSYSAWIPGQNPSTDDIINQQTSSKSLMCLGIQWMSSPTPMIPSGLYWKTKKCSTTGGYVCKRKNYDITSEMNYNRTVNGTEGRITSPNYPGNYYNNLDFLVKIIGPERTRLIIQFSKIDLESQTECLYDYVELRSVIRGNNDGLNDVVKWCGNHDTDMRRFDFVSETNEAELRFHSDYSLSGSGFSVTWQAVDVSGCPLQTLTAREGIITSPNYPHFLLGHLDCAITILAPAGKRVWLEIVDIDMNGSRLEKERELATRRIQTNEAILELDLGGSSTVFRPFQVAGQLTDGAFVSNGERLQVRLRTADRPLGAGFKAIYKTLNGVQEERIIDLINTSAGVLLHLNYPNPAPAHVDFLQHLVAPLGNTILLELYHVRFSENGCLPGAGYIEVVDNYADSNGTSWHLCHDNSFEDGSLPSAPLSITSYLNTLHIRQRGGVNGIPLNGSLRVQNDGNYKIKLLRQQESIVETCNPNPCKNEGKCISNGNKKICQCTGHFTGLFCALTLCELEPCVFGHCTLTTSGFRCQCQPGYTGITCEQKQRPCEGNPCEGRGDCIERGDSFHCRCHAWWEGARCERRMMHIPFRPLSERMLHEPFWLGLITVTVVLAIIGLVWCARRHFPEKLEKLLAEESDRNRIPPGPSLRSSSVRDPLAGGGTSAAVMVVPSPQPGCQRGLFGRLGIRKPSILSLTSPHGHTANHQDAAATARTFSLDDLLKPPPRRTPSPRKKRNNSTPTKKNAAEKKQILQQLISPGNQQRSRKVSIGELIQLSERKSKETDSKDGEMANVIKETQLCENNVNSTAQITLTDPKLEKKVTFARLLNKVSAEMSSGSEVELGVMQSTNKLISTVLRPASTPPSPAADFRSPNSTSSNQGSDSLSSSELALPSCSRMSELLNRRQNKLGNSVNQKPTSADSILHMFRNFSSSSAAANFPASVRISPSTTPTASTPQDDVAGDDESTTSSIHTPISFSSGPPDSPPMHTRHRQTHSTIEVPVLDALSAHKSNDSGSNFLHPPTILLEVPSISKCLSPIREMPTPLPSPLPTPKMSPQPRSPILQRSNASSSAEDLGLDFSDDRISIELPYISQGYSDGDDDEMFSKQDIVIDIHAEDGLIQEEAAVMQQTSQMNKLKPRPPPLGSTKETVSTSKIGKELQSKVAPLIIPKLTVQQPSPTHTRPTLLVPGSPPPQRLPPNQENVFHFTEKPTRRLLKDFDKPTSLDLPCAPPMITITCNMSEAESDAESISPAVKNLGSHLGATTNVGMCYLSPFSMCSRADRTASESNLSSSGYSSMASPGPSRCGSNNPLCPSEMEDPGPPGPSNLHSHLPTRRPSPLLRSGNISGNCNTIDNNSGEQKGHCRGRSDSETLSDDPLLESNDEGIGTDHLEEKIEDGELKSAKELELYIDSKTLDVPKSSSCLSPCSVSTKCDSLEPAMDRLLPPPVGVCKVSLQLPSIVVQSETSGCDKYISPVSSRSESPLSDRTFGLGMFSPNFYNKQKDFLPFTDSDGLYDFPSSDCTPQNKISLVPTVQHRKSGRRREKKSTRTTKSHEKSSPTKNLLPASFHHYHLDVPTKESHFRNQQPRKPSPKRRVRNQQLVSSSSSTESLTSARELKVSSSSPSPDTIRWSSPTNWPVVNSRQHTPETSGEDTADEVSPVPFVAEEVTKQTKKISRLRAISHQIRFLRRLEKSLKQKERLSLGHSDSLDSGDGDECCRVTSPLLQQSNTKAEIRKSSSISKLQATPGNTNVRFKRGKTKKGSDLLIPQEDNTWKQVLASGNGHSD